MMIVATPIPGPMYKVIDSIVLRFNINVYEHFNIVLKAYSSKVQISPFECIVFITKDNLLCI